MSELVSYDIIKEKLLKHNLMTDNFPCHVVSGLGAGFIATVVSSPVDVVKTRFMSAGPGEYKSVISCATILVKEFGFGALYKGYDWRFMISVCLIVSLYLYPLL